MLVGVPMIPLLIITGTFMLASMWCMYLVSVYVSLFLIIAYVPIVVTMRQITKKDDQRLRQMLLRARMRVRHAAGRKFWSAISYSPIRFKKRKVTA